MGWGVRELALVLGARALAALELAADLEGEPARVLHVGVGGGLEVNHRVHHGHSQVSVGHVTCVRVVARCGLKDSETWRRWKRGQ